MSTGRATSFARPLVAIAIGAPTLLGVYPVRLALVGMGFGPAAWVAMSWQLASMVTWSALAIVLLRLLRPRTDANVAMGQPALSWYNDAPAIWPPVLGALALHAVTITSASELLLLGRGRPAFPGLILDALLLYAPMNVMTVAGLMGAAVVAAEDRGRLAEAMLRQDLEHQLADARLQVLAALAELNGPAPIPAPTITSDLLERIAVTSGRKTTVVHVDEIDWIEARSYYARLHVGTRQHLIRLSMNELERRLDPGRFARIHRSTIVNLDRVAEVHPHDRRSFVVVLRDGRRLMMSRRRRRLLDFLLP